MVTLQRRFNPLHVSVVQLLDQIGTAFLIDGPYTFHTDDPGAGWRGDVSQAGGGCIIDMGYHIVDLTGLRIDAVEKYLGHFEYTSGSGILTRQLTFEVTVTRTGPVTLTEHDAHEWAGPDGIPAVSDAVRELVTR
ncbi:hypothetical protein ACFV1W_36645 [Kitasatospora sp. NPDC059648]|uniref:hypothetical protein n=1 Tax=Kitasatospora sp. NPDC059648 TaxID=3346894 RepID=UPI0036A86498